MNLFYSAAERATLALRDDAPSRLSLAWALRQIEPERSAQLFGQCRGDAELPLASVWQELAQAEAEALAEQFEPALHRAATARTQFQAQQHALGATLCTWVAVQVAWAQGAEARVEQLLEELIDAFERLGQHAHADLARLELAARCSERDLSRSQGLLEAVSELADPTVSALRCGLHAHLDLLRADFMDGTQGFMRAFDALLDCGMRYRAVACCTLVAYGFSSMGDSAGALEWAERGLELADPSWTLRISTCRFELGSALAQLRQAQAAARIFATLITELQDRPASRVLHQVHERLAELACTERRWEEARGHYAALLEGSLRIPFVDFQAAALGGLARCSLEAGQIDEARGLVAQGLVIAAAQHYAKEEQRLLTIAARIELQAGDGAAALQLLEQVRRRFGQHPGAANSPELLRLMARAQEQLAQWQQALLCERMASESELAALVASFERRLKLQKLAEELQQARVQNETLRRLSAVAAQRASTAEHSLRTLEKLAQVGRGLTARLQPEDLFPLLERELRGLLPVDVLLLFERSDDQLLLQYGRAGQELLHLDAISLDDPHALTARCAREGLLLSLDGHEPTSRIPGVAATQSLLFAPLRWQERVIGVLSLQAHAAQAYGPSERQLVLNLAAYLAIAMENARTHQQVSTLEHELAERRRQAALGSLVAGVAHELNTPLGNSLMAVSAMQAQADALREQLQGPAPRRSALQFGFEELGRGAELATQNLGRAIDLLRGFKELAADPDSEAPTPVDPAAVCSALLQSRSEDLRKAGLQVLLDFENALPMLRCRRQGLLDVLEVLLDNVLVHAKASQLQVLGRVEGSKYRIDWIDNGRGIQHESPQRVFDPFVSTRFGQGRSGLGLSIALHRARSLLQGELRLVSPAGAGCHFVLTLPVLEG